MPDQGNVSQAHQSPLKASRLALRYDMVEDRLVLLAISAADTAVALLLTRRLVARLLNGLSQVLEKSSPLAQRAPSEMRGDVILLEHQGALKGDGSRAAQEGDPSGSAQKFTRKTDAAAHPQAPAQLVHTVSITTKPKLFEVVMKGPKEAIATFSVSRTKLHQFLNQLRNAADQADWQIELDAAWLTQESQEILLNFCGCRP